VHGRLSVVVLLALKAALVALPLVVLVGGTYSDRLDTFALTGRALTYPVMLVVVPFGWLIAQRVRRRPIPYPVLLDIVVTTPFVLDLALAVGTENEEPRAWLLATHFVNWTFLAVAAGLLLPRERLGRLVTAGLIVGAGAVVGILWELAEYPTLHRTAAERVSEYGGTLGDLALGLAGALVGAVLVVTVFWNRRP
jgi:hypothetical protein